MNTTPDHHPASVAPDSVASGLTAPVSGSTASDSVAPDSTVAGGRDDPTGEPGADAESFLARMWRNLNKLDANSGCGRCTECVGCSGVRFATADALERFLTFAGAKFRRVSAKFRGDARD